MFYVQNIYFVCTKLNGADKESRNKLNQTPLHLAAKERQFEMFKYLVENGVNTKAKDCNNQIPSSIFIRTVNSKIQKITQRWAIG